MTPNPDRLHGDLGELATMSHHVDATERRILARATELLDAAVKTAEANRRDALAGVAEASRRYQAAIAEKHRCEMVLAQAKKNLGVTAAEAETTT